MNAHVNMQTSWTC